MAAYTAKILRIDLTNQKTSVEEIPEKIVKEYLGGRGFAAKLLWDEVKRVDPLSEASKLIFATGPLSGQNLPSSGKMVIAAKSPLTNGYGDGNIGGTASVSLKKAGYDVLIIQGKCERPSYVLIEDSSVKFLSAEDLWGKFTFEVEEILQKRHRKDSGILLIGPGGENLVSYAIVCSQKGRAGGRPGMGAVMGSKNLKAIVIRGTGEIPVFDNEKSKEIARAAYKALSAKPEYSQWLKQGTMQMLQWCNENACLPTRNYRESVFDQASEIDGHMLEKLKTSRKGCAMCSMQCGNIIKDANNNDSELDYENVAMLGANVGLGDLRRVAVLNRMADEWGLDAISLGNSIGFYIESAGALHSENIEWGDFNRIQKLITEIGNREGVGAILSQGVRKASAEFGHDSEKWAMHVKGLEVTAYNCNACPGQALAYGTSPIGASHKDAWVIRWEVSGDRLSYGREKVKKVIESQRIRGGFFEALTVCRLVWAQVHLDLDWYPKLFSAVSGVTNGIDDFNTIGDRIYNIIRAFWIRENGGWQRRFDYPPERWFDRGQSHGQFKGVKLDREQYDQMLSMYYQERGWDLNGVPSRETFTRYGLADAAAEIEQYLSPDNSDKD